jgi:hypothetical protein
MMFNLQLHHTLAQSKLTKPRVRERQAIHLQSWLLRLLQGAGAVTILGLTNCGLGICRAPARLRSCRLLNFGWRLCRGRSSTRKAGKGAIRGGKLHGYACRPHAIWVRRRNWNRHGD